MSRVRISTASASDNAELLRLMADMPMPGYVRVAYRREPSFFEALRVEGDTSQVVIGRDAETGRVIGMGTRSIKSTFVNGLPTRIGYLSSLRLRETYRHNLYLARGYQKLRDLHGDGQARIYLSTMLNDNAVAQRLTPGRALLPAYHDIGQVRNLAISLRQSHALPSQPELSLRTAGRDDIPRIIRFLREEGPRRQFFPAYTEADLLKPDGLLSGLRPEDISLAFSPDGLEGVLAAWDQKAFRRSVVTGYPRWLATCRPIYNLYAAISGLPMLPGAGATLDYVYLSLVCIRRDDRDTFAALLAHLLRERRAAHSFVVAGMHERDPLLPVLRSLRHLDYPSRLYVVCWEDGEETFNSLDDRVPYLEVGSL